MDVSLEVFTVVHLRIPVFWDVMRPCRVCDFRHFRGTSSSRFQGEGHRPFTLEHEDDRFLQHVWSHLSNGENHIPEDWNPGKWMRVDLTFMEPCIARCVFYITNEMQLIQCSLSLSALNVIWAVFPPIIRSL